MDNPEGIFVRVDVLGDKQADGTYPCAVESHGIARADRGLLLLHVAEALLEAEMKEQGVEDVGGGA